MSILEYMKEHLLVLDGGMGTLLQAAGLAAGELPERWNLTHPTVIRDIHRDYLRAGSHVINANTFGANGLKFFPEELEQIVCAAVRNAREAQACADVAHPSWVALDIGPSGKLLKPYGDLDFEDAVALFAQVVRLGVKYGVDLITVETMNDSYEAKAALLAAKENSDLPVIVTCAYGSDGKLMTGADPAAMVAMLEGMGADAIGANCSLGAEQLRPVVEKLLACASVPVLLKPNAGLPQCKDGKTVYDVSPQAFAQSVSEMVEMGVNLVGGCCGTTPDYIRALAERVKTKKSTPVVAKKRTVVSSYTHAVVFGRVPVLIGERINPTGKKRFKQALTEGDLDYVLQEGLRQQENGAHVLDVNVGLPQINERELLTRVCGELQAIIDLPLQIDTADAEAMEAALRRYNGKAMVNSVNGKAESMQAVFQLVKKYGGVLVALTLDEQGIPETAEGRLEIAKKILREAEKCGIGKEDLIFDPLAMSVSSDSRAAVETLRAVKMIGEELGCCTSLGVSNVSFGLPDRDSVNSTFFAQALENGLSAAIMNPDSLTMRSVWHTHRVLHGLDENCADYIAFSALRAQQTPTEAPNQTAPAAKQMGEEWGSALQRAISKGLGDRAAQLTAELLQTVAPLEIVQREIVPALDAVGRGFEEKTVYLPQLLMSAEAAKAAFGIIKERMEQTSANETAKGMQIVLATVKGDIHDIGKNIVRLLLENYGFEVIDLGRDVPPERVVEEVVRRKAPMAGLSALMTTTVPAMEETVALLHKEAPWCRVAVGGAVLTREYAESIHADRYCKDAMEAVRYAESLSEQA